MNDADANTQLDDGVILPDQLDKTNTVDVNSDSSSDSGANHEQENNGVQKRINKITADKYQMERERDEAIRRADAAELNNSQAASKPAATSIDAPTLPEDIYDEDEMRKYHSQSQAYNQQVATQAAQSTFENQQQKIREDKQKAESGNLVNSYYQNAIKDGVNMDSLKVAEMAINQSGINQELAVHIMGDPNGGKIVEHLHNNPELMHELVAMSPMQAAIKIANEIKPQVISTTKNVSSTPAPINDVKGGGVHEQDEFEKNYPGVEFI